MARFVLVLLAIIMLSGCGLLGIGVNTNIPYRGTVITVENNTSVNLEVVVNGKLVVYLKPGEYYPVKLHNMDTQAATFSFIAIGRDNCGNSVGVASRSYNISGYQQYSDSWVINAYELRRRE